MKKTTITLIGLVSLFIILIGVLRLAHPMFPKPERTTPQDEVLYLPEPSYLSAISIEQALLQRRSIRSYQDIPLDIKELSQLLWAAQGITAPPGYRTAPSAGALYPLELYVVCGEVAGLPAGVYKYLPVEHGLVLTIDGDRRVSLSQAALGQDAISQAPVVIVITAVFERTKIKYGERGVQYVHMEVGSVAQNVYLQAESLNLGTVFIGAFQDEQVEAVLDLPETEIPLALLPVGKSK
jgi:SagB-type dehydrogenase family enzyme